MDSSGRGGRGGGWCSIGRGISIITRIGNKRSGLVQCGGRREERERKKRGKGRAALVCGGQGGGHREKLRKGVHAAGCFRIRVKLSA